MRSTSGRGFVFSLKCQPRRTTRTDEIRQCAEEGMTTKEIAEALGIVGTHVTKAARIAGIKIKGSYRNKP